MRRLVARGRRQHHDVHLVHRCQPIHTQTLVAQKPLTQQATPRADAAEHPNYLLARSDAWRLSEGTQLANMPHARLSRRPAHTTPGSHDARLSRRPALTPGKAVRQVLVERIAAGK